MGNTDQQLIDFIRSGDTRRFGELVDKHKDRAMTLAVRLVGDRQEAEELLQDAFVRAYRNLNTFRGDAQFGTWFYRILYNLCMTHVSRRKGRPLFEDLEGDTEGERALVDHESLTALEQMEEEESSRILLEELQQLPAKFRTAVTLFYVQGMPYEEIAAVMSVPLGTVRTYLFRGRRKLRERLLARSAREVPVP